MASPGNPIPFTRIFTDAASSGLQATAPYVFAEMRSSETGLNWCNAKACDVPPFEQYSHKVSTATS